ncbi:MAG: hypothetical protein KDH89_21855, partial [Anaerolineae bacterium]|nr:hypothetical protein [Anaerolineae bacterium]
MSVRKPLAAIPSGSVICESITASRLRTWFGCSGFSGLQFEGSSDEIHPVFSFRAVEPASSILAEANLTNALRN